MRNMFCLLLVICLLGIGCTVLFAATDDDVVTITVDYVDLLQVPATAALTLTTATPGATAYDQGTLTQSSGLLYSHNSSSAKKITATAVADVGNAVNDVTLKCAIAGGTGSQNLVTSGTDQSNVLLWAAIVADGYTKDLSWTVDGTLATTIAGANVDKNYIWTVTYTTADN